MTKQLPSIPDPSRLMTAKDLAVALSIAQRTVWRLNATGKLPAPIRLGRCVRWRTSDIEAWLQAGCPSRG